MDIPFDKPEMPEDDEASRPARRGGAATRSTHDVGPNVDGVFPQSRANDVSVLVRLHRPAPALQQRRSPTSSARSWRALLGRKPKTAPDGLRKLDAAMRKSTLDDAAALRYLTRRAYRDEWLYAPAVTLYPERNWSPID